MKEGRKKKEQRERKKHYPVLYSLLFWVERGRVCILPFKTNEREVEMHDYTRLQILIVIEALRVKYYKCTLEFVTSLQKEISSVVHYYVQINHLRR